MRVGADVDQLDALAVQLAKGANQLEQTYRHIEAQLARTPWKGRSAEQFRQRWHGKARAQMHAASSDLQKAATAIRRQAAEQRRTSESGGGSTSSWMHGGPARPLPYSPGEDRRFLVEAGQDSFIAGMKFGDHLHTLMEMRKLGLGAFKRGIPIFGTIVGGTEYLLAGQRHGFDSMDALDKGAPLILGTAFAMVATGGGLAFEASYTFSRMYFESHYGKPMVDVTTEGAYRIMRQDKGEMTPSEAAAYSKNCERPSYVATELAKGAGRGLASGYRKITRWFR